MRRATLALITCFVILILESGAYASISFKDTLNGSLLGKASTITYEKGIDGQAAAFRNIYDYICYDKSLIPKSGTFSFYVKPTEMRICTFFSTVGMASASNGDMTIYAIAAGNVGFWMYDGSQWNRLYSSQLLTKDTWNYIAVSYGSEGMKLYVNESPGRALTSYTGNLCNKDLYAGDYPLDNNCGSTYLTSFTGDMDNIQASNIQSDPELITAASSVPEPNALLTIGTGLLSIFFGFKRKFS